MGRDRVSGAKGRSDRRRHGEASANRRRRAAGLEIVERDGRWHVHGTVVVKDRSRRVRRSTGLVATRENWDAAIEIRRQSEAEIRDEFVYGVHPSVPVSTAV